jgi:hypothetical protein
MLGKLIKHEFKASARTMLPFMLVSLVLAVLAGFSMKGMESQVDYGWFHLLFGLVIFAFVAGLMALSIVTIVMIIDRFRKNLLGDEGYLMFTLPVTVDAHIWAKMMVSSVWMIATGVVSLLAIFIAFAMNAEFYVDFAYTIANLDLVWNELGSMIKEVGGLNLVGYVIEGIVLVFVNCYLLCLRFYSAMAIGYSFANRKVLLSVVAFVAISIALSMLETGIITAFGFKVDLNISGFAGVHIYALIMILYDAIQGAILYIPTSLLLKKKLNLP